MRSPIYYYAAISISGFLMSGCRESQAGRETFSGDGHSQELHEKKAKSTPSLAPTWADLEKMPKVVMAEPSIEIAADGTSKAMRLRFRLRPYMPGGINTSIPQIKKITIGKPEGLRRRGKPECLVMAEEAMSMKVWRYGETPPGFTKVGCNELGRGEYVISVQFLGGYGGIRIVVDKKGTVTPRPLKGSTAHPWDGK